MANLRVVYDNAADRATITASTTAGSLAATNLKTELKSEVWRSTGTTATLTATWAAAETVGMMALVFANLTPTATVQVKGYTETADAVAVFDTGAVLACPAVAGLMAMGTVPQGVNGYAYGGSAYGVCWFTAYPIKKLTVLITDTSNTAGYVEVSRLVTGNYWSPVNNAEVGAELSVIDTSKQERTDAGDLRTDRGTQSKALSVDFAVMTASDRNYMWSILRGNGLFRPVFFSLSPQATDAGEEQLHQIYGKVARQSAIRYQLVNQFSSKLEIEEV